MLDNWICPHFVHVNWEHAKSHLFIYKIREKRHGQNVKIEVPHSNVDTFLLLRLLKNSKEYFNEKNISKKDIKITIS